MVSLGPQFSINNTPSAFTGAGNLRLGGGGVLHPEGSAIEALLAKEMGSLNGDWSPDMDDVTEVRRRRRG